MQVEQLGPEPSAGELEKLTTAVEEAIESEEIREAGREAAEHKRHEMVEMTATDANIERRTDEINTEVRWTVEDAVFDAVQDTDAVPDQLDGHAYDAANAKVETFADTVMDEWAISETELAERLATRREQAHPDPDAKYEAWKEKQMSRR